jgi:aminoglycoside phosphotransferase (APT) family kinase protein
MGRADVYLQPQASDPVLGDDLVLWLVRRYVPYARALTGVDESGGEARAYFVDDIVVLKTQRPHRLRQRTSLAKEAYLLDLLAPRLDGRIPRLLGYDQVGTAQGLVEYVCMTRVAGRPAQDAAVCGDARRVLMTELGTLLRTLHAAPVDPERLPTDGDAAALRRRLELSFADIADAFAQRRVADVDLCDVIDRSLSALPATLEPSLLHSNPGPTHVFVDPVQGQFTGLIDFGDSYVSHPALDLHRWPDPADRVLLHDAYVDGATPDRDFDRMWTIAMIHTDLAVIAAGSAYAHAAAADLVVRQAQL